MSHDNRPRRRAQQNDSEGGFEGSAVKQRNRYAKDPEDPPSYDEGDSHGSMADEQDMDA